MVDIRNLPERWARPASINWCKDCRDWRQEVFAQLCPGCREKAKTQKQGKQKPEQQPTCKTCMKHKGSIYQSSLCCNSSSMYYGEKTYDSNTCPKHQPREEDDDDA